MKYSKYSLPELRKALQQNNISTVGVKAVLVEKLVQHLVMKMDERMSVSTSKTKSTSLSSNALMSNRLAAATANSKQQETTDSDRKLREATEAM